MSEYPSKDAARAVPARRAWPILGYLGFLVAVVTLPILAFSGALIVRQNQAQLEVVETFTIATTRGALQSVEREVSGMITTLRVLMNLPSFLDRDYGDFHARAQIALAGTGAHLVVSDSDFQQLTNTRVPYGTPLGLVSDQDTLLRAFASPDTQVSPVFFGETAQDWVFNVVRRFPDSEMPAGAAILTADADTLNGILVGGDLPLGWHVALVDGGNRVIATSHDELETGSQLFLPLSANGESTLRWLDQTLEGVEYKTITQRSLLTGWYVVAWAPNAVVEGPIRTSVLLLVAGGLVILALAGYAAFLVARQIARSVRGLSRDARSLGAGEAIEAKTYPVAELTDVSHALAAAGASRRAAESEAQFLMRELAHRSKNQLTVIGAMAKQTAQGAETVDKFVESFQHRIQGLARSTDLLLAHGSGGIALYDLIEAQLEPFRPEEAARVEIAGPKIRLNVQAAQVLGMAMHEMATNAAKYGAFAGTEGTVAVLWTLDGKTLELSWREHVADFTPPADHTGFGTVVVKKMVAATLQAQVDRHVHDDGIGWTFSIPLEQIDPERGPHDGHGS